MARAAKTIFDLTRLNQLFGPRSEVRCEKPPGFLRVTETYQPSRSGPGSA